MRKIAFYLVLTLSMFLIQKVTAITWQNEVDVSTTKNSINKINNFNSWSGGASSQKSLSGNGYVSFQILNYPFAMIGLSNGDTDQSTSDMDFAIYMASSTINIYESGQSKGSFGNFDKVDVLKVEVVNGVVNYLKNGVVFYTSVKTPIFPLNIDTSIWFGEIKNISLVSQNNGISWANPVEVTTTEDSITKSTSTNTGWSAGVISEEKITGNGYVEFQKKLNTNAMLGLSNGDSNQSYIDIDFAIYHYSNYIRIYENGSYKGAYGNYLESDVFRIEVIDDTVKYLKNDVVFYTSLKTPTYPLNIDSSLYYTGLSYTNISLNTGQSSSGGITVSNLSGNIRNCVESNNDYAADTLLSSIDILECKNIFLNNNDIQQLSQLTSLAELKLNNNSSFTDISPLTGLGSLTTFFLINNSQVDLTTLVNFNHLLKIYLHNMGLTQAPILNNSNVFEIIALSQNSITNTGLANLPTTINDLQVNDNNLYDCSGFAGKNITSLTIGGSNFNNISNCGEVAGLKTLVISNSYNMVLNQSFDNTAGLCTLGFVGTNIENLTGSRPIQKLFLVYNAQLKTIDVVKKGVLTSTDNYPDLIPTQVNSFLTDNMLCSSIYNTKSLMDHNPAIDLSSPLTTRVNNIDKTMQSCGVYSPTTTINISRCAPDLMQNFTAIAETTANTYTLSWSKQDHDVWGVTNYQIRTDADDNQIETLDADVVIPHTFTLTSENTSNFEVRACVSSACGDWALAVTTVSEPGPTVADLTGNLRICVESQSGNPTNAVLSNIDSIQCEDITLNNSDIIQLSQFIGLAELLLSNNNEFTDISPLSNLGHLYLFEMSNNSQVDLSSLANFTNIAQISLNNMGITQAPALSDSGNLEYIDLSNNPIIGGLSNLPNSIDDLYLQSVNLSDCSGLSGKNIRRLRIGGDNLTDVSNCSSINGLKYFSVIDSPNMNATQSINDFAGICDLVFQGTNIEHIAGSRPISKLYLLSNLQLKSFDLIKSAQNTSENDFPNLIPSHVSITGTDSMSCSSVYGAKATHDDYATTDLSSAVTTTVDGVTETMQACYTTYNSYKTFNPPTTCHPDLITDFTATAETTANNYTLDWSKQDHDVWGVTSYDVRVNADDNDIRNFVSTTTLPLSINIASVTTSSFEVRACVSTNCGDWQSTFTFVNDTFGVDVYSDATTQRRFVTWEQEDLETLTQDGYTNYEIKAYDAADNVLFSRQLALDYQQSFVSYLMSPVKYTVSLCADQICGFENADTLFGQGLSRVNNLSLYWEDLNTREFKLRFNYHQTDMEESAIPISQPDEFRIIAGFAQSNGSTLIATIPFTASSSYKVTWETPNIDYNTLTGNGIRAYACNSLLGCGASNNIAIALPVTPGVMPTPQWQSINTVTGSSTKIELDWLVAGDSDDICDTHAISGDIDCVDYIEINEWQPKIRADSLFHQVSDQMDKTHTVYKTDKINLPLIISRLTYSGYDFDLRSCHRDRENGDICSEYSGGLNKLELTSPDCSTSTTCNLMDSDIILTRSDVSNIPPPANVGWYPIRDDRFNRAAISWTAQNGPKPDYFYLSMITSGSSCGMKELTVSYADKVKYGNKYWWTTESDCAGVRWRSIWNIQSCINGVGCSEPIAVQGSAGTYNRNPILSGSNSGGQPGSFAPQIIGATPGDIKPGHWWNDELGGTGWNFNLSSKLAGSNTDIYDLIGHWYAYREINGVWTPVWFKTQMTNVPDDNAPSGSFFEGQLFYYEYRDGNQFEIGAGDVKLYLSNTDNLHSQLKIKPIVEGGIFAQSTKATDLGPYTIDDDGWYVLSVNDIHVDLVNESLFGPKNDDDHFSGIWEYQDANEDALVSMGISISSGFEYNVISTFDTNGDPIWFVGAAICLSPETTCRPHGGYFNDYDSGATDGLNLLAVRNGFNPLAGRPLNHDFGANSGNSVADYYGKVARKLNDGADNSRFKEGAFCLNMVDPLVYPNADINYSRSIADYGNCTNNSTVGLIKTAGLHDISYLINNENESAAVCDPVTMTECNIKFRWYTDDDFLSIKPYYSNDEGGSYSLLSDICQGVETNVYAVESFVCDFTDKPGIFTFQLRKTKYGTDGIGMENTIEMALSRELEILECNGGNCLPNITEVEDEDIIDIDSIVTNQPGAGPIPGSGGVSGGSATYNLPLVVPPGRNGMTPSLSVNYSSKGGNGILGVGWSLSVGSSIYRCPQTLAQDDANIPVRLDDSTDRLCMDGQRLMKTSGAGYFASGAQFRTEQDSFAKITRVGNDYYVKTKSGRTNVYQQNPNSGTTQQTTWYLTSESDTFGNVITYVYNQSTQAHGINEILLTTITYSGSNNREIRLSYSPRTDKNVSYLAGQRTDSTQKLDTIETWYPQTTGTTLTNARIYSFNYLYSKATNRLILNTVTERAKNNITRTLLDNNWSQDDTDNSGWLANKADMHLERIGLDTLGLPGAPEYCENQYFNHRVFKNGIREMQQSGDVNGDGIQELTIGYRLFNCDAQTVEYTSGSYMVSLNKDGSTNAAWEGGFTAENSHDFDHDGRIDKFVFQLNTINGVEQYKLLVTKSKNGIETAPDILYQISNNFEYIDTGLIFPVSLNFGGYKFPPLTKFHDVDSDGDLDLFVMNPDSHQCTANTSLDCHDLYQYTNDAADINNQSGIKLSVANSEKLFEIVQDEDFFQTFNGFKDVNGDGQSEIIVKNYPVLVGSPYESYMIKNPNTGLYETKSIGDIAGIASVNNISTNYEYHQWLDVNSDGLEDLIVIDEPTSKLDLKWAVKLNKGGSFYNQNGFNTSLFSNKIISNQSDYLYSGLGPRYEYGFTATGAGDIFHNEPRRSNSIRIHDIDVDGKNELIIANPDENKWNFCRFYRVGLPCLDCVPQRNLDSGNTSLVPASSEDIALYQTEGTLPEVYFMCSTKAGVDPSVLVDGTFYAPLGTTIPYQGSIDHGIYGYDVLKFKIDVGSSGEPKLIVSIQETDIIGDINGTNSADLNNDGINDTYSNFGCEWQGCLANGEAFFDGNLGVNSVFYDYINNYFTGANYEEKKQAFKESIQHNSSYAINKVTAVMPDMLISVLKPFASSTSRVEVSWAYQPLSTPASDRPDFPLYTIPKRDSGDSYVDEDELVGDHFYFNSSMYVVSEMRTTNNYGNDAISEYAYEEAVYNNKGRGFQGFRKISVRSNPDVNITQESIYETISESTFHQVFPYAGKLEKIEVKQKNNDSDLVLIQKEDYLYQARVSNISPDSSFGVHYHPLLSKTSDNYEYIYDDPTTSIDEENNSIVSTTITQIGTGTLNTCVDNYDGYDDYGNINCQAQEITTYNAVTEQSIRSEKTITDNTYFGANEATWWIDKLEKTTVTKESLNNGDRHVTYSNFFWQSGDQRKLDCQFTYIDENDEPLNCGVNPSNININKNTFEYDLQNYGNITKVTTQAFDTNAIQSRVVETDYFADGYFPESITEDPQGANLTTSFTYDNATGQVKKTTAPDGNYNDSTYDVFGFKTLDTPGFRNDLGSNGFIQSIPATKTYIADCISGCSSEQAIVNNVVTQAIENYSQYPDLFLHHGAPTLVYKTEQLQNGQAHAITYYDNANNPVLTKTTHTVGQTSYVVSLTNPMGITELTTQPFALGSTDYYPTIQVSDVRGRIIDKVTEVGNLSGNTPVNCQLQTMYTHVGGFTEIIVNKSGTNCSATDIGSLTMSRRYDATGKLLSTKDTQANEVKYWYDASGNPRILRDAQNNDIVTSFDALGRKSYVIDPNMGRKDFTYNGFGEVIEQKVTGENYSTYYQYDNLGRITSQYSNVSSGFQPVATTRSYHDSYIYNDTISGGGRLDVVTRQSNKYDKKLQGGGTCLNCFSVVFNKFLDYDVQNRLTHEITTLNAALTIGTNIPNNGLAQYVTQYLYDSNHNRLKQVIYEGNYSVENRYTKYGTLQKQIDVNTGYDLMQVTDWNFKGQETSRIFNGDINLATDTTYYPSTGQVAQITNSSIGDGQEVLDYAYDVWGNIKTQELSRTNVSVTLNAFANETFVYDNLHRLESSSSLNVSDKGYVYNSIGNITQKSDFSTNYTYGSVTGNAGPNAVSSAGLINGSNITYGYDVKGNRITDSGAHNATYVYDYNNLLIESTSNVTGGVVPQTLEFNYGADNQRYRKYDLVNNEITLYANKDYEQIFDADTGQLKQHKYYLTSYLTIIKDSGNGTRRHFMQKDRLGSTTQILDEFGDVLHTKSYDAFGKPRNGDWSDMGGLFDAKLAFDTPLLDAAGNLQYDLNGDIIVDETAIDLSKRGFTDHEHLDEMQLIHMNGRMYDYNNGRFLSVDPFIQNPSSTQSMNPYTYIFNNPLSGVDPTGYFSIGNTGSCGILEANCRPGTPDKNGNPTGDRSFATDNGAKSEPEKPDSVLEDITGIEGMTFSRFDREFGVGSMSIHEKIDSNFYALPKDNSGLGGIEHFFGFFNSDDFKVASFRTAQTVGGGAEVAAGVLACAGSVGLGCGYGVALMADGLSNVQEAITQEAGFVRAGIRGAVNKVGGNEKIADAIYTGGSLFLSFKAFTAPVRSSSATQNARTLRPGAPGKLGFIKPKVQTVKSFQNANFVGIAVDVSTTTSSVISYLDNIYNSDE